MNTDIELFVGGKPACFAVPQAFHPASVACMRCCNQNECGSVVAQIVEAIHNNSLTCGSMLKSKLRRFEVALSYWDDREKHSATTHSLSLLEKLVPRSIAYSDEQEEGAASPGSQENSPTDAEVRDRISGELIASTVNVPADCEFEPTLDVSAHENGPQSPLSESIETAAPPMVAGSLPPSAPSMELVPSTASAPSSAVKPTKIASMSTPTSVYQFPMPEGRPYKARTNGELTAELDRLVFVGFHATPSSGYASIRAEICAIHIEMNLRQEHAPRFRPMQDIKKDLESQDQINQSLDRQVIDIHWMANSSIKPLAEVRKYPTIFNNDPFDIGAANQFAQEVWTPEVKAVDLSLSENMQWMNAIIQTAAIRNKWRVIKNGDKRGAVVKQTGAPQIEKALRDAISESNRSGSLQHIPGMIDAWKASRIVGDKPKAVARMISLMTGKALRDDSAVRKTLTALDHYLGKPSKAKNKKTTERKKIGDKVGSSDSNADTNPDSYFLVPPQ